MRLQNAPWWPPAAGCPWRWKPGCETLTLSIGSSQIVRWRGWGFGRGLRCVEGFEFGINYIFCSGLNLGSARLWRFSSKIVSQTCLHAFAALHFAIQAECCTSFSSCSWNRWHAATLEAMPARLPGRMRQRCSGRRDGVWHREDAGDQGVGVECVRKGA